MIVMKRSEIFKGGSAFVVLIILLEVFSFPLMGFPPLGSLFFPGNSVWENQIDLEAKSIIEESSLTHSVTVYRDQYGIPHIFGKKESDVIFALGYTMAQDRLFMMEMARSITRGNMSSLLGSNMIEVDKYNLAMLKDYYSVKTYQALVKGAQTDPELATILMQLERFCDGVNYFIEHTTLLPLEFQLLEISMQPWTVVDTLCMAKYMAEDLTWSIEDLYHYEFLQKIGIEAYNFFLAHPRPYQIPICPNYGNYSDFTFEHLNYTFSSEGSKGSPASNNEVISMISMEMRLLYKKLSQFPQEQQREELGSILGSNNWVVDGNLTASGRPIICNDMHLGWNLPGIWYQAHVVAPPLNLWGFFLPGVPYPLVGQNSYVSWGFTNTYFDSIDWYYYQEINSTHYVHDGEITPYEYIPYRISTKEGENVEYNIKITKEGPVFSDFLDNSSEYSFSADYAIACQWIAHNVSWELRAFYNYAHAQNRADFDIASTYFWLPSQNHAYADVWGNIAIRPTGKIPIRDTSKLSDPKMGYGQFPFNGSAGEGKWLGWLPFDELPVSLNPEQHYLVSANQIAAGPEYMTAHGNQTYQTYYSNGYRARRINQLLTNATNLTIDSMKHIQLDTYSIKAENFIPILLNEMSNLSNNFEIPFNEQQILQGLSNWDYQMDAASWEPTIFKLWVEILKEEIFLDEFMEWNTIEFIPYISDALVEYVLKNPRLDEWFDNISSATHENRQLTVYQSFNKAISTLQNYFANQPYIDWKWGSLHINKFNHLTGLSGFDYGPVPANGSADTINPSYGNIWQNNEISQAVSLGGASERWICDWGRLNESVSIIPSGQRGVIGSEHFMDQLMLFLAGDYHLNYFTYDNVDNFPPNLVESVLIFSKEAE
ncbi:MAG: hypothetical protein DRO88_03065 [Promethearchaeia archaeon]|nr:MAG: hypothetical protein DRO88_03065 [Candidatus Lokiarchaeia archaeon]